MLSPAAHTALLRVLLVEDSLVNQKLLAGLLDDFPCDITIASDGQEAVDVLSRQRFDVVFMDVQMPVMDGLTATRLIRERESKTSGHTLIIGVTAGMDRETCLNAGMDDYLAKPVRKHSVKDKLNGVLRSAVASEAGAR